MEKWRYLIELERCKESVWINVRYLIELRAVRSLFGEIARYSIELRTRSLLERLLGF